MISRRSLFLSLVTSPLAALLPLPLSKTEAGVIRMRPGEVFENMTFRNQTVVMAPNCKVRGCTFLPGALRLASPQGPPRFVRVT